MAGRTLARWLGQPPGTAGASRLVTLALAGLALLPAGVLLLAGASAASGDWLSHLAGTSLPAQVLTSLQVATVAALVAFAAGAVPAVAVARHAFPGRGLVATLALSPLLLSPSVAVSVWSVVFSDDAISSRQALGAALGLACGPYVFIVFLVAALRQPASLDEMAAACGLGRWQRWWRLALPSYAVPTAASGLIVWAQTLGDYAAAERLGVQTLSQGLHAAWFATQRADLAAELALGLLVPAAVLVVLAARAASSIITQAPLAAAAAGVVRHRRLARVPTALLLIWSLACALPGFVIPEVVLLRWAWLHGHRARLAQLPGDTASTLLTAVAVVAVVLGLCVAVALSQRPGGRGTAAAWTPWLFLLNLFLPTLVLALAFVLLSRDGSLLAAALGDARDTRVLVVAATALRLLPFALLPTLDALRRTPPGLVEMARACGAGPLRARLQVFRGCLAPALGLGCALVFVECVKELDLALTLQPFGYGALALKVYAFSRNQNLDRAAFWVLAGQACMVLPLAALAWRAGRRPADAGPTT